MRREAKLMYWMAVVFRVLPIDYGIFAVNAYRSVVVRDGEGKELTVQLLLTLHKAEELNDGPRRERHAVGVLAVRDVECCGAALHLAGEEGEVHKVRGHEEGQVAVDPVANKWRKLAELILCKGFAPKPHGVVGLRTGSNVPAPLHLRNARRPSLISRAGHRHGAGREAGLVYICSLNLDTDHFTLPERPRV